MNLKVNFQSAEAKNNFANRFKIPQNEAVDHLDVPYHFLDQLSKHDTVSNIEQYDLSTVHDFIVKGEESVIIQHAQIKETLGNGFYIVSTNDAINLLPHVESIEITSISAGFLATNDVSTITSMNVQNTDLDPAGSDGQWARIRVASRYRPLLTSYVLHDVTFLSEPELIIMDSGINFTHPEFQYEGLTFENLYALPVFNNNFNDDLGHGTSVASMAVGKNLGVGRKCKLVSVKIGGIVDGATRSASLYELGCAIDAILARVSANPLKTRILNMSWGVNRSAWLDSKVQALIDAGVTVICAAGNDGKNVEDISPAGIDDVITVGAIDKYDMPAGYNSISPSDSTLTSSYGLSLDIFAPGSNVLVAFNSDYKITSGTSFSAPLIAGIATEIAALNQNFMSFTEIKKLIIDTATKDALLFEDDRFSENQNRLGYIYTSDSLCIYKDTDMVSYLGAHDPDEKGSIQGDLNSSLNLETYKMVHPEDIITYSIEYYDQQTQDQFGPFINIDPLTGIFTLNYPTVSLSDDVKLKMVEFKGVASTPRAKLETNKMFFFMVNPLYKETYKSDITLALTEINSVSFFEFWGSFLK